MVRPAPPPGRSIESALPFPGAHSAPSVLNASSRPEAITWLRSNLVSFLISPFRKKYFQVQQPIIWCTKCHADPPPGLFPSPGPRGIRNCHNKQWIEQTGEHLWYSLIALLVILAVILYAAGVVPQRNELLTKKILHFQCLKPYFGVNHFLSLSMC